MCLTYIMTCLTVSMSASYLPPCHQYLMLCFQNSMCSTYMRTCFTLSTSSEQQSSSENRVELLTSSCSWQFVTTSLFSPIAMRMHLNYDQALGHFLQHDLLIAHGGLRHLQDTVQDGGSKCSRFSRCSSCSPVQGSEVGPCLPEFTLLTRLFLLHLVDCAVAINKDNKGSHP